MGARDWGRGDEAAHFAGKGGDVRGPASNSTLHGAGVAQVAGSAVVER